MSKKYIVVFKDTATDDEITQYVDQVNNNGGTVSNRFESSLKGFAAAIPDQALNSLQASITDGGPIESIEADGIVTTQWFYLEERDEKLGSECTI